MLEISLRQLETFVVTAECGGFTKAAETLHLTQSTVSTHVQTLEKLLDCRLILRGARKRLELTETGKRVYAAAKEIVKRAEALESMRESIDASTLIIAASTVPAQALLPGLMSAFIKKNPSSRFSVRRGDSGDVKNQLERGDARIGFMGAEPDKKRFISYPIAEDSLIMITENSPKFRALKQRGATGLSLLREPMLAREDGSGTQQAVNACLASLGADTTGLNIIARVDNPECLKAGVIQGMGVCAVSSLAAQEEIESGKVLSFELGGEKSVRTLYIAYRKDAALNAIEQKFVSFVRAQAQKPTDNQKGE